jgi:hypothetical protein
MVLGRATARRCVKEQRSNGEFHRADPARRRHMSWLLAVTVALAAVCLVALHKWLAMPHGDAASFYRVLAKVLAMVCFGLALVGAAFAAWLFRLASATHAERRWPPSSMRTSSDVKIRYLTSADALVLQMKAGAIALTLLALGLATWGALLLRRG